MILQFYCSMCGKQKELDIPQDAGFLPTIEGAIVKSGWIVQHNNPHIDLYCSNKCAE